MRTSWVYAAKGSNFLRTIARLARERHAVHVVNDQIGAPTSAALVAGAIKDMLKDDTKSFRASIARAGGVVHLASAGETSWPALPKRSCKGCAAGAWRLRLSVWCRSPRRNSLPGRCGRPTHA